MNKTAGHINKLKRIEKAAFEIENTSTKLSWQLKHLAKILPSLRKKDFRKGVQGILNGYLIDYRKANRKIYPNEINVELPIDKKIPFEKNELSTYMSFVGFWVAGINFVQKEFGKKAEGDVVLFLSDMAKFYPQAAVIYNSAQTSFERGKPVGLKFKLLHFIDSSKNASPSLHVEVAAHTFSRITEIIKKHSKEDSGFYEPIINALFIKAVRILESVLLVKQHVVMDIALGLAALSAGDQTFSQEKALNLVNAMFKKNTHGIDAQTIAKIRETIILIYSEALARIKLKPEVPASAAIIEYLKNFYRTTSSQN